MGGKVKGLGGWWTIPVLLSVASFAAPSGDLSLVEAVQRQDKETVRSLLQERVDLNASQPDGATALSWAVHWDDLETAELLIHAGADVNAANAYGVTPLWLACVNRNAVMVAKLLEAGADSKAVLLRTGETALMRCAITGNAEAVKSLLAHGADPNAKETRRGQTALMWAIAGRHSAVARALIEHRADIRARSKAGFTPLLFAAQQGDVDLARMLLAFGAEVNESTATDGSALVVASASGHEALSIFLLEKGADPNAADGNGITPLHYAVQKGLSIVTGVRYTPYGVPPRTAPELVKALLARGANPNARIAEDYEEFSRALDRSPTNMVGATPFLLAAVAADAAVMRLLAAGGADPSMAAKGNTTPLMAAAGAAREATGWDEEEERKALEAVKLAVELGADVNAADERGRTAMHAAAFTGADSVIQFLADKGANVDVKDKSGQTPWSMAAGICPVLNGCGSYAIHRSTADLLLKLGATQLTAESFSSSPRPSYVPAEGGAETIKAPGVGSPALRKPR